WRAADVHQVPGLELDRIFYDIAVHPTQPDVVLFVGLRGHLASSDDGGERVELRSHSHATGVVIERILAGESLPNALATVRATWNLPSLNAVTFAGDTAYAVGWDATFLSSNDLGKTWRQRQLPLEQDTTLWDIVFI